MKPLAAILVLLAPGILLAHAQRAPSSRDTDTTAQGGNPRATRGSRKFGTEQQEASWDSSKVNDNQESSRGEEVVRVARRPGSRDRGYTQTNFQEPDTASSVIAPVTHQLLSRSFSQRRSFADAREEDLVETAPRARTSFDSREIADKPLRRRIPSSVKPEATDDNTKGRSDVNTAPGEDVQRIRGGRRKSSTHAPETSADNVGRSQSRRSRTTTISPAQEQLTHGFEGARRRSSPKDTALTSPSDATTRRRGPANEGNEAVAQEIGSRVTSSTGGSQEISKNSRRKPSRTSAPTTSDDSSPLRSRGGVRRQTSTQETAGRSSRTGSGRQTATTTTTTTSTTTTIPPPVSVTVKDAEELQVTVSSEPEGVAGTRDHIPVVETVDDLPANTGPASIVDAFSTTSKVNGPNSGKPRESVGESVDVSKISRNAAGPRNASPSPNDRRKKTFSRSTTAEQASESQSVESSTAAIFSRRKSLRNPVADRGENIPASRKQTPRNWRTTHSPLDQDEPITASAVPETANLISFPLEGVSTTRGPEVVPNELNAIPESVQPVNAEQGFRRLRVPLRKDQTETSGDAGSQEIARTRPSSRSNAASGKRDSENTPVRSETVPKFNRRPSWTRPAPPDDANLSPTSSNRDRTTESSVADVTSGRRKVTAEPSRRGVDPQISKGRPKDPLKFEPRRPARLSSANAYRTSHEQVEVRPESDVTLEETQPMEVQETRDILKNVRYTEQAEPSRSPQSDLEESFITRSSQQVVTITVLPETTSAIQAPVNSLFSSRSPDFPARFANLRNKYRASLDADAKASSGTRTRKYQKPGSDAAPATESSRQIPATVAGRPEHGPRHRFSPGGAERPLFSAGYRKSSSPPSPLEEDASRPSSTPGRSTSGIRRSVPVTPPRDVSTTSSSVAVPRFSARYKSDLLRAATGLRATTTPVYLPTVPTVRPNTSTTTEGTSITTSSADLLIVASTIGAVTATTRTATEETTIADFDDEILGANSDNEETSEESPATTEAPAAMTTLPPPPPLTTPEPLGETTTTTETPPTTAMVPVSETTTPTATTTTTEETITTSTPTPVLEGSPSGEEPVTSSPASSTDPPITTESTTTTEPTTTTTTEPTTTTTEPTTTTTTTTEPTTTTTTTTEPTTTTTTTTEPTTTTTTTTETTTTSAQYSPIPAASRFVSRMTAAPIGTPSSTPATNLFDDFNSVYQTAQRREDTDEGSSSLLLISSLRNRLTTPRAERRISDQENDINYQPPAGNSFTSFNLGLDRPSPPLFASSRASVDFPGYSPTQSPYYNTPARPPRTPVPYVIFGIFPNNTVFRKFPNSNVKEIVSENEIANRQPYYPEQRGNDYDVYRPTAGYSEGRNFSPFVSSVTVTPSTTTERAVLGPSESDEEEENHLLLFLSVNRGASSSTEQPEVDVRIGEPSTVVFTSTETPSSIGEPSSLVLVSTEPPSSTTTEPTTTTTTEPSTTTTTTEPSTTTTTTEPATTTTTTEPSTTTTTTEPSTTTTTTEPSTTTTTTEPSTTTTTTEPSTTTTTTEPSTTTTTTEPSTTATSTATVFVVTPAQSDDKPLGAPKSPDSSGKESVPGGKNPPGSLPDISGLGNSLQGQTRSSSPRPTGNQDSPSALANRIIEMALQRQKAVTSSQLVGSASTPRSVMVSTAGAENELLRLLGQSAGRLPQSPTTLKGTAPDSTALLALLQNSNKDASKTSQHLLASFSGRQPTQSDLLNKINLGEVLNLAAQMKPSGTATPQGGLRQVFSSTGGGSSGSAQGLVDVAINMTRAMSTLMGQVIQGAAQSLQSFVRERTGNLAKYFSFGSG